VVLWAKLPSVPWGENERWRAGWR